MKTKHIITDLAIALFSIIGLSSCDDYLDVNQPSIYTNQNLYQTSSDCEAAIAGVYNQLQKVYNCNYHLNIIYREDCVKNMNNNAVSYTHLTLPTTERV